MRVKVYSTQNTQFHHCLKDYSSVRKSLSSGSSSTPLAFHLSPCSHFDPPAVSICKKIEKQGSQIQNALGMTVDRLSWEGKGQRRIMQTYWVCLTIADSCWWLLFFKYVLRYHIHLVSDSAGNKFKAFLGCFLHHWHNLRFQKELNQNYREIDTDEISTIVKACHKVKQDQNCDNRVQIPSSLQQDVWSLLYIRKYWLLFLNFVCFHL